MRLLMLAPPGAGKGTQAARLAQLFNIEHIASGDLLRQEVNKGSDLGRQVKEYLDRGDLVPDELVMNLIFDRVKWAADRGGFVLDGFPRNVRQAEAAYEAARQMGITLDGVINLQVPRDELLRRLLERAAEEGRGDDRSAVIRHRLDVYDKDTEPLIEYYRQRGVLIPVNGDQPVEKVTEEILSKLKELNK
jgi:adenylate kinase